MTSASADSRPVLVGLDGSTNAESAMWWAVDIAVASKRPLRMLTSYSLPVMVGMGVAAGYMGPMLSSDEIHQIDAAHRQAMNEAKAKVLAAHPDLSIEIYLDQGSPATALLKASEDASMIVLGTRGIGSTHALVLGSVSYAVAHRAKCPVVLVPETSDRSQSGRVVVGVDGSQHSLKAATWALHFAETQKRPVELVSAWHYPYAAMSPEIGMVMGPDIEELRLAMQRDARKMVEAAKQHLSVEEHSHVSITTDVVEGSATEAMIEHTRPQDYLVVGSRSRSMVAAALLGGTALTLAHRSRCPIVIVH
ncbi:MAG: universal stress protein [Ilumatobacteraceae bacterium]